MEFKPWPKTPRLFRDIVITEKIDGSNACVVVTDDGQIGAQSRNRLVTPESDNAGFARWVSENTYELTELLGPGYHYGEWWGSGINRGYGLTGGEKRFSLFNTHRWSDKPGLSGVPGLGVVPKLYHGVMDDFYIDEALSKLQGYGSVASPGFMDPEGIIVYHSASRQTFKVTFDNDGHKGVAA